jgi:tripartite-type tricarboxylate transporter receptor subunit TctC
MHHFRHLRIGRPGCGFHLLEARASMATLRIAEVTMRDRAMMTRRALLLALVSTFAIGAIGPAAAQNFPSHPITVVVPFLAGGPADALGRIVAEQMRISLGQSVLIENATGAAGSIGVGRVARATPDGYTLVLGLWSTHVANRAIYTLGQGLLKDFEPVAQIGREPAVIVARKTMPAANLAELIAWAQVQPGQGVAGTGGLGSLPHIAGVLFQHITDTRYQFLHYRGAAPAMQDLMAGQIDLEIDSPITSLPLVRSGGIKAYAVMAKSRLASPEIPTVDEAGLPGFYFSNWFALFGPKRLPKDVTAKLNAAVVNALAEPTMRQRITDQGEEIPPREELTQALGVLQKAEIEKWWPIINAAGIKVE